jgi:glycosyltransferase involved in cell wall biosynthesis
MALLLTICVPTFNREDDLRRLVACLDAEIGPRDDIAVLISDNHSTDGTEGFLAEAVQSRPWLRVHRQPENVGVLPNIRWLVDNAPDSDYLWSYGDDDLLAPGGLATIVELLEQHRPAWLFLPHLWTTEPGQVVGGSPAPGTAQVFPTGRELYLAYHHWLTFATASILRSDSFREALHAIDDSNAYAPLLWFFRAGLEGPCVVAPEHALLASQSISWADRAHIFQTLHFTALYDDGLKDGLTEAEFGSTLDGLYANGFGLDLWRKLPADELEERVRRFPQSLGLRGYLWTIAREQSLTEPLAAITAAAEATGAASEARDLIDAGEAAFASGDLLGAAQRFRAATQLLPTLVTAWNDLAVVMHELGRTGEARAAVETALFVDPDDESARENHEQIVAALTVG